MENKEFECEGERRSAALDDVYHIIDWRLSRSLLISDLNVCEHCDCGEERLMSRVASAIKDNDPSLHVQIPLSSTHTHTHAYLPKVFMCASWLHPRFHRYFPFQGIWCVVVFSG